MKSPKEKAKELVERFHNSMLIEWGEAIDCALICCDEIIEAIEMCEDDIALSPVNPYYLPESKVEYFKQVKDEITRRKG